MVGRETLLVAEEVGADVSPDEEPDSPTGVPAPVPDPLDVEGAVDALGVAGEAVDPETLLVTEDVGAVVSPDEEPDSPMGVPAPDPDPLEVVGEADALGVPGETVDPEPMLVTDIVGAVVPPETKTGLKLEPATVEGTEVAPELSREVVVVGAVDPP